MLSLVGQWREHLDAPLCGRKPPLKRFHMYDCQNSLDEFSGWSRTETDYFCHQLAMVIATSGVSGYGIACSRKDWDELVADNVRAIMGDPEGLCVQNCIMMACAWAQHNTFDPQMKFVFDRRPGRERENKVIFDTFQRQVQPPPELVGIAFLTSHRILPLQAADFIAWEFYQHANEILSCGELRPPSRQQFKSLGQKMKFRGQIARRGAIEQLVAHAKKHPRLKEMADHFMTFDPDAPGASE